MKERMQVVVDLDVRADDAAAESVIREKVRRALESIANPYREDQGVLKVYSITLVSLGPT